MSPICGVFLERFHHKEANFSRSQAAEIGEVCIREEFKICTAALVNLERNPPILALPRHSSSRDKLGMLPVGSLLQLQIINVFQLKSAVSCVNILRHYLWDNYLTLLNKLFY